jgi:hypothetical protein
MKRRICASVQDDFAPTGSTPSVAAAAESGASIWTVAAITSTVGRGPDDRGAT